MAGLFGLVVNQLYHTRVDIFTWLYPNREEIVTRIIITISRWLNGNKKPRPFFHEAGAAFIV